MSDEKLIELIAQTWVGNGGDREGFCFSIEKIKDEIKKQEVDKHA